MPVPWLIVPTYQEAENIEQIVARARATLQAATGGEYRILIVDDRSPDGTGEIADRLARAGGEHVEVLHRDGPRGLGKAYSDGFARAIEGGASHVFEMDADGSHDPQDLARLFDAVREGADLALGSRYVPGGCVADWGVVRRAISRCGSIYARLILRVPVRDLTGGFKCFRADVLQAIDLSSIKSRGYAFQVELTYRTLRSGFQVVEVPITFRDREHGKSKMSGKIALEAVWLVWRMRGWRPR